MSGHSHWSSIKHKKGAADEKKGEMFSKLSKNISVATRGKGSDIETNPALRIAVEKAKSFNMPKDNIMRAIKKGAGELDGVKLEKATFEVYGPEKVAIIIEVITDNKNRTLGEIKNILSKKNGKLAEEGSVRWLFNRKGIILIDSKLQPADYKNKETLELAAIEANAEDIFWDNDLLYVYAKPNELEDVKKGLKNNNINIGSTSLEWIAKEPINIDPEKQKSLQKLFEALDENEDVQEIYSNLET